MKKGGDDFSDDISLLENLNWLNIIGKLLKFPVWQLVMYLDNCIQNKSHSTHIAPHVRNIFLIIPKKGDFFYGIRP